MTRGPWHSGLKEKTITLDVAKRLAVLVKERLGCSVVMTRDQDEFIRLSNGRSSQNPKERTCSFRSM